MRDRGKAHIIRLQKQNVIYSRHLYTAGKPSEYTIYSLRLQKNFAIMNGTVVLTPLIFPPQRQKKEQVVQTLLKLKQYVFFAI